MPTTGNPEFNRNCRAPMRNALGLALLSALGGVAHAETVLCQTEFEAVEGYGTNLDLVGQLGWQGVGSGGNGILDGVFPGRDNRCMSALRHPVRVTRTFWSISRAPPPRPPGAPRCNAG